MKILFMNRCIFFICIFLLHKTDLHAQQGGRNPVELKTASTHPMQYYISLPANWSADKKWPVVVAVEAAEKEFKVNAERFATAARDMPFIIVSPIIVTNGNAGQRDPNVYPYSTATWDKIDKDGICSFDMEGLAAVMKDVRQLYKAEDKFFMTGFEAGTHLVWAMIFQHPEQLHAAVVIAGNFRDRCVEEANISKDISKEKLPIRSMYGEKDSLFRKYFFTQWVDAKNLAMKHGYKNLSEEEIKGKAHIPLPAEALNYFLSLLPPVKK